MIYLGTSAAAKLVLPEPQSDALAAFLAERIAAPLVSSVLLYPELLRAVTLCRPGLAGRAIAVLQRIMTVPLAYEIVTSAATIGHPVLRTLDALHLATAVAVSSELDVLLTFDILPSLKGGDSLGHPRGFLFHRQLPARKELR